ncbi:ROK family transcriptional regulator [Georgenia sp. SYP-B2076]|uniref:ROK family transcriptional regulator n=1 Tax=Georgenia sp. SYP-B2076 TaxID=2495881 RepID=UPI001F0B9BC5|nr:ROK family transcriptional regulator [Georgenia sp. SYP-B2076]
MTETTDPVPSRTRRAASTSLPAPLAPPTPRHGGAARQSSLRENNLAVLTQAVFASPGPVSRADLAADTGLTRSTVSRLVEELLDAQIVVEQEPPGTRGPGRPAVPLAPAPGSIAGMGLQVNVDYMAGRVVDLTGQVLAEELVPGDFEHSDPGRVLARTGELARSLFAATTAAGAVVAEAHLALPGLVDVAEGRLLLAPNLGWRDLRPADHLGSDVIPAGVRLEIDNDANLAGYGVAMAAPGRRAESSTFIYVSGDIGIGSALVAGGHIITGQHGWAGEIGHVAIEPDGPQCPCGARGCLERYAGMHAIFEAAQLPPTTSGAELAAATSAYGPPRVAVERAAWALGIALANMVNIVDVGEVVLGAGFIPLAGLLRPGIEEQLRLRALAGPWSKVTIRTAPDDRAPATTGGAFRALDSVIRDPAAWIAG